MTHLTDTIWLEFNDNKLKGLLFARNASRLHNTDIILEEVAPGVDVDKDIISKMNFLPKVKKIEKMDERIFYDKKMGIREDLLHI